MFCYHSVQILRSSRLLSQNVNFKIHTTVIFPVVMYQWNIGRTYTEGVWEQNAEDNIWISICLSVCPSVCLSIRLSVCLWLYSPFVGPWPLFWFLNPYTVGRTPWTRDQLVARPLPTHRTRQTQNKRIQSSMPWVGFDPTIPMFERSKTIHALDHVAMWSAYLDISGMR
jgi:hypothetical protein